jgi:hypothetical protein
VLPCRRVGAPADLGSASCAAAHASRGPPPQRPPFPTASTLPWQPRVRTEIGPVRLSTRAVSRLPRARSVHWCTCKSIDSRASHARGKSTGAARFRILAKVRSADQRHTLDGKWPRMVVPPWGHPARTRYRSRPGSLSSALPARCPALPTCPLTTNAGLVTDRVP